MPGGCVSGRHLSQHSACGSEGRWPSAPAGSFICKPRANSAILAMSVPCGFRPLVWGWRKAGKINFGNLRRKSGLFYKDGHLNSNIFNMVSENSISNQKPNMWNY